MLRLALLGRLGAFALRIGRTAEWGKADEQGREAVFDELRNPVGREHRLEDGLEQDGDGIR
jgi:hypothetical protein